MEELLRCLNSGLLFCPPLNVEEEIGPLLAVSALSLSSSLVRSKCSSKSVTASLRASLAKNWELTTSGGGRAAPVAARRMEEEIVLGRGMVIRVAAVNFLALYCCCCCCCCSALMPMRASSVFRCRRRSRRRSFSLDKVSPERVPPPEVEDKSSEQKRTKSRSMW